MTSRRHTRLMLLGIVAGVVAGILGGWFLPETMLSLSWMGHLFINALKMLILPLIVASITSGIGALGDVRKLGRIGGYSLAYFLFTTLVAVFIGLVMVNLIRPGEGVNLGTADLPDKVKAASEVGIDMILNQLIAPNLVGAAANFNLFPVILFAILFGAALTMVQGGGKLLRDFDLANAAMMKLVGWVMAFAPLGFFSLVGTRLGQAGGGEAFWNELQAVSWHVVTVLSSLALHGLFLLGLLWVFSRRGLGFVRAMGRALITAFGTASSNATIPISLQCAEDARLSPRVSRFVIPLGSTINMNGTALYEAAAAMFIAQAYGLDLSLGQQVIVLVTATIAAIGAAGVPEAGLVMIIIVLNAVGLPQEGIALLLAVDWFLDRFRTMINVWGDYVGTVLVGRWTETSPEAVPLAQQDA